MPRKHATRFARRAGAISSARSWPQYKHPRRGKSIGELEGRFKRTETARF
jgi:hypothetical protein